MNVFALIFIVATCLLVATAPDVCADSYRCGSRLVRTGDSTGDLLRICGQPRHKDRGHEKISLNGVNKKMPVERWYYKKGSRSLERIFFIYRGQVVAIDTGSR